MSMPRADKLILYWPKLTKYQEGCFVIVQRSGLHLSKCSWEGKACPVKEVEKRKANVARFSCRQALLLSSCVFLILIRPWGF